MSKKSVVSAVAALVLSGAIAGPTFAGAPTYSGTIWCTVDGISTDIGPQDPGAVGWTRKQINDYYRFYVSADYCDSGSLDMSHLTKEGV